MPSTRPTRHQTPAVWRLTAAAALTAGLALFTSATAEAHVHLLADSTASGSFSQLTFRVPNESPTAATVEVAVQLPQDEPFPFVSVKPIPGWEINVKEAPLPKPVEDDGVTITKAARTVTWTASKDAQIAPGEYQDFSISVGPLPDEGEIVIPAVQTYSDKTVVSWDEPTPASGDEPEHPAPTFTVTAAVAEEHHASDSASPSENASAATPAATETSTGAASSEPDTTALWLSGIALLAAVAAVALAAVGLRRGAKS